MGGISSRLDDTYLNHRILWDLDDCTYEQAIKSLSDVQQQYNLGCINIISDKNKSYGAVCNTIVSFKELLHILIDTQFIDEIYVMYALRRMEAILRLSDKEGRLMHRDVILKLYNKSDRLENNEDFYILNYETGFIKNGLKLMGKEVDNID